MMNDELLLKPTATKTLANCRNRALRATAPKLWNMHPQQLLIQVDSLTSFKIAPTVKKFF